MSARLPSCDRCGGPVYNCDSDGANLAAHPTADDCLRQLNLRIAALERPKTCTCNMASGAVQMLCPVHILSSMLR